MYPLDVVNADALRTDNHFVARGYLKRWADGQGRVWTHKLLVEHANVREWSPYATSAVAKHQHLYTKMVQGRESDEVERWLDREIESPAEAALERATTEHQLRRNERDKLLRYVAAQQVRTPAFFVRRYPFFRKIVRETLDDTGRELRGAIDRGGPLPAPAILDVEPLPLKIEYLPTDRNDGSKLLHLGVPVGRSFWLWVMKFALDQTWHTLRGHQWLILKAPRGFSWCTSDDPVVVLPPPSAAGEGGWNQPGSEFLFPSRTVARLLREGRRKCPIHDQRLAGTG